MFIVLDSNIWISELGLSTSKGAATRFYALQKKATFVLPEIIQDEVESNLYNSLSKFTKEIEKNHRQLLSVFGTLKEVVLPTDEEITNKSRLLFNELKIELRKIPFSLESAKHSLYKINAKKPPSDKNQQFKDGVIWADCMNLLKEDDVILVTEDKAFFSDRKYSNGIANNLREEAKLSKHNFIIHSSLTDLLGEIKSSIDIDSAALISQFTQETNESINSILERNGFSISSEGVADISTFVTGDPNNLYIEFRIRFDCDDILEEGKHNAVITLNGDGAYDIAQEQFIFHFLRLKPPPLGGQIYLRYLVPIYELE